MTTASKVRKIIAAAIINMSLLLAIFLLITQAGLMAALITVGVGAVIMLPFLLWPDKSKNKKKKEVTAIQSQQQPKAIDANPKDMIRGKMKAVHIEGLSMAANVNCILIFQRTILTVSGNGIDFELPYSRIFGMQTLKDSDIQNHYVSSVGGAIGGAFLFGTAGAMIGGRTKKKTTVTNTYYYVISYERDSEIKNLVFKVQNPSTARSFTGAVKDQFMKKTDSVKL